MNGTYTYVHMYVYYNVYIRMYVPCSAVDVSQPVTSTYDSLVPSQSVMSTSDSPVPTLNSTEANSSSNQAAIGGVVGGVASFLLIVALCIMMMLWCVRHSYKRKKAYHVHQRVHYKAGSDVIFYPNLCSESEYRRTYTTVYNDYGIITNTATNASKSCIQKCMYVCLHIALLYKHIIKSSSYMYKTGSVTNSPCFCFSYNYLIASCINL